MLCCQQSFHVGSPVCIASLIFGLVLIESEAMVVVVLALAMVTVVVFVGVGVGGGVDSETLETFRNLSCMCIWFMTHTP